MRGPGPPARKSPVLLGQALAGGPVTLPSSRKELCPFFPSKAVCLALLYQGRERGRGVQVLLGALSLGRGRCGHSLTLGQSRGELGAGLSGWNFWA